MLILSQDRWLSSSQVVINNLIQSQDLVIFKGDGNQSRIERLKLFLANMHQVDNIRVLFEFSDPFFSLTIQEIDQYFNDPDQNVKQGFESRVNEILEQLNSLGQQYSNIDLNVVASESDLVGLSIDNFDHLIIHQSWRELVGPAEGFSIITPHSYNRLGSYFLSRNLPKLFEYHLLTKDFYQKIDSFKEYNTMNLMSAEYLPTDQMHDILYNQIGFING